MCIEQDIFIEPCDSALISNTRETEFDPITGSGPIPSNFNSSKYRALEHDNTTRHYSVNVFSTTNDKLFAQFHTNMIMPIVRRTSLDVCNLREHLSCDNGLGVFIIERYLLPHIGVGDLADVINYYVESRGLPYDDKTIEQVRRLIFDSKGSRNLSGMLEIRLVTFIPRDKLISNQYTYVTGPGVVICHGTVPSNLNHPYSEYHMEDTILSDIADPGSLTMDISIVTDDAKPRYLMLGKDVKCIRPIATKRRSILPKGCTIVTNRGGEVIDDKYFPIEDFEENGLYNSRELCITNGNRSLAVEESKYHIELAKVELELRKLKEANKKLTMEHNGRIEVHKLDMTKRHVDTILSNSAKEIEIINNRIKSLFDNYNKMASILCGRVGVSLDQIKAANGIANANRLTDIKIADQVIKTVPSIMRLI